MRPQKFIYLGLALLTTIAMLAGCGSSQNAASTSTPGTPAGPAAQGVAVDPYIVGAIFQEIAPDGTVLQRESTPSDANGHFQFPGALTEGSTIVSKPTATGTHNGVPYTTILKRKVSGTDSTWVVSPLTTMTAAGLSDQQVLDLFSNAGLTGLTAADLTADPMSGLTGSGSLSASTDLAPLQANMAANTFMAALGNNNLNASFMGDAANAAIWQDTVAAVTNVVSSATFQSLANDPNVATSGTPMTVADFIQTATNLCQAIGNNIRQAIVNGGTPPAGAIQTIVDNALATAPSVAHQYYMNRMGPGPALDGAALYASDCASCHGVLASSSKAGRSAAQIQAAISNVGAMGSINLSAAEIQAIADALAPATTPRPRHTRRPTVPPSTPATAPAATVSSPAAPRPAAPPPRSRPPSTTSAPWARST